MSINPVLGMDQTSKRVYPIPEPGEVFEISREGVDMKVKTPNGTMKGRGEVFLSSRRLVFVKKGDHTTHKQFTSLEIPLRLVGHPQLERSIFVDNLSVKAVVTPDEEAEYPLAGPSTFWIKGGCGLMLMFFRLLGDAQRAQPPAAPVLRMAPRSKTVRAEPENVAYIDPEDPSVLFIPVS